MHWRSLLRRIVEKPINNPVGTAKLAKIVASLIPYIVKRLLTSRKKINFVQEIVQVCRKKLEN
tara:strand:+ start:244 stop:432 length:189 start_codon:yes stop_codon:yes gene_type:complete